MSVIKRYNGKRLKSTKDKNWVKGTWYVRKRLNGRIIHKAIPEAQTKEQAEIAERKIIEQAFNRRYGIADTETTVKEFANGTYLKYCEQHNKNVTAKKQSIELLTKRLGKLALVDVSPQDCRDFQHALRRQMSDSSVNRIISSVSKMFRMACEEGKLDRSPMEYVKRLDEPPRRERLLTDKERERLWFHLKKDILLLRLVTLAVNLPLRKAQILAITPDAVDLQNGVLLTTPSKGRGSRPVPLNSIAVRTLDAMIQDRQLPFPLKDFRRRWSPLLVQSGINKQDGKRGENFTFHDLRKEFAYQSRRKGVDAKTIQHLFAHSDMSITDVYILEDFEAMKDAVNRLDAPNPEPTQEINGPPN